MHRILRKRYLNMIDRCYNPNARSYKRYGGRGIRICDEWLNDYNSFEKWCLSNGFQCGLAIDRIDNDGDYSPTNCRFVTLKENNQKRCTTVFYTIDGEKKNLQQWCEHYGIKRGTVYTRIKHGWDIKDALTTPVSSGERDRMSLIGKKFGRLTVVAYAGDEHIGSDNNSRWVCSCECGKTSIVGGNKLKSGHTKSCGCIVSEMARERMLNRNPMKKRKE